jgi:hypothetical protein
MDPDADPGGLKHADFTDPDPDEDPDADADPYEDPDAADAVPEHWYIYVILPR